MKTDIENPREPRVGVEKDPVGNLVWLSQYDNSIKLSKTGARNLIKALEQIVREWSTD